MHVATGFHPFPHCSEHKHPAGQVQDCAKTLSHKHGLVNGPFPKGVENVGPQATSELAYPKLADTHPARPRSLPSSVFLPFSGPFRDLDSSQWFKALLTSRGEVGKV